MSATKTAVQNMAQAGADLLAIKGAIEGKGVVIVSATPTSNYAGLITNNLVKPTGTLNITENGEHNVAQYAMAEVDVAVDITVNESYDISEGTLNSATITLEGDVTAHIPDGVITVGNKSFMGNETINKVIMPDSVTTIEYGTFQYPGSSDNAMAFGECINLKEVILSNALTTIGDYAFSRCTSLTSIIIPDSVTTIGDYAFLNCTSLTSIIIPDSVTTIGHGAFNGCTSLTDIYYTGTQAEWEAITGLSGAGVPAGATLHYEYTPV